jgi:hypothetical protein
MAPSALETRTQLLARAKARLPGGGVRGHERRGEHRGVRTHHSESLVEPRLHAGALIVRQLSLEVTLSADAVGGARATDTMTPMAPRAPRFAAVFMCALFTWARPARAESQQSTGAAETRPYLVTIRGAAGLGTGSFGVAGRAALSGEGWFSDHFAAGALWGESGQGGSLNCFFCPSQNETLQFFGATVAARTAPRGSYGLLEVGAAYAWGQYWATAGPLPQNATRGGVLWSVSGAWLFHPYPLGLETGPVLVMDVTTWGSLTLTANWALGFAL